MFEKVKEMLVENLHIDESSITPEAELENDLGINSLEIADLVLMWISVSRSQTKTFRS